VKKLILTSLAIAVATSLFSYGIDETNFNDLLNYRLPKWSYWSGNIRLEGNNSYSDTETYRCLVLNKLTLRSRKWMDFHSVLSMRSNERKCVKIMDKFEIYLKWTLSTLLLT
jgi:hypothetical protein